MVSYVSEECWDEKLKIPRHIDLKKTSWIFSVAIAWFICHETSLAHAAYTDSFPRYAEELQSQPEEIVLHFTQELFRRVGSNTITVTHEAGTIIEVNQATIDNDQRKHLHAKIRGVMEPERYIIEWTNLSAEDGDQNTGRLPFYLGRSASREERLADITLATEQLTNFPNEMEDVSSEFPSIATLTESRVHSGKNTEPRRPSSAVIALAVVWVIAIAILIGRDRHRAQ